MNIMQEKVLEFHQKFKLVINKSPTLSDRRTQLLRLLLLEEELNELKQAIHEEDLYAVADALGDLAYVLFGASVSFGIDLEKVFNEIHRSNMTKIWPDGTVHYNEQGKVIKPETYSKADIGVCL